MSASPFRSRRGPPARRTSSDAVLVRIELDPVIPPGLDHRLQSRIDREAPDGAERARRGGFYLRRGRPLQPAGKCSVATIHNRSLRKTRDRQYAEEPLKGETNKR